MKTNPIRYGSAVGESRYHLSFKVKYCRPIFNDREVKEYCHKLMLESFERNHIRHKEIGLWNPAYYIDSLRKDMELMQNYVRNQRYFYGQSNLNFRAGNFHKRTHFSIAN